MQRLRSLYPLCALLFVAGRPAVGANLVASGQFDQPADVEVWSVSSASGGGSIQFEPAQDEGDCAASGSALLIANASQPGEVEYSACVGNVVGGQEYAVGAEAFFPKAGRGAELDIGVAWFAGPDCTGEPLFGLRAGPVLPEAGWQKAEFWSSTDPDTVSARVSLWITSSGSHQPLGLVVDGVFVRPVKELFADGFELGEICRWNGL